MIKITKDTKIEELVKQSSEDELVEVLKAYEKFIREDEVLEVLQAYMRKVYKRIRTERQMTEYECLICGFVTNEKLDMLKHLAHEWGCKDDNCNLKVIQFNKKQTGVIENE